jgi:hypothetical protein
MPSQKTMKSSMDRFLRNHPLLRRLLLVALFSFWERMNNSIMTGSSRIWLGGDGVIVLDWLWWIFFVCSNYVWIFPFSASLDSCSRLIMSVMSILLWCSRNTTPFFVSSQKSGGCNLTLWKHDLASDPHQLLLNRITFQKMNPIWDHNSLLMFSLSKCMFSLQISAQLKLVLNCSNSVLL